ncbi:carbohydrate kinase [Salmonella enterica subsp. enterica serovar Sanjuan]|uniref:Carbohydrate kinase n=1 Tax=Salmonella enterica subsp. enterica serovar Sanjuan TaxID=1160765 RepID=A0A447P1I8_SALET|nr:hypothetical protein [Salmonella enterica subsp. enterica serovar Worthington]MBP1524671.1 hypothetical protein [Salmonella enterica subsp. enterica serovar Worthington]VEA09431.1 carbohydrate kinase [Salmonella enterica subsp. enterica serovar Sanjuan]
MNKAVSSEQKPLDVICLGRVAVDLYGQQIGSRLEDMTTFAKYLGDRQAMLPTARPFRDYVPLCWPASAMSIWDVSFVKN